MQSFAAWHFAILFLNLLPSYFTEFLFCCLFWVLTCNECSKNYVNPEKTESISKQITPLAKKRAAIICLKENESFSSLDLSDLNASGEFWTKINTKWRIFKLKSVTEKCFSIRLQRNERIKIIILWKLFFKGRKCFLKKLFLSSDYPLSDFAKCRADGASWK